MTSICCILFVNGNGISRLADNTHSTGETVFRKFVAFVTQVATYYVHVIGCN